MLSLPYPVKKALLHPLLQPNNLPMYALSLIIHLQQPDTASRLPTPIRSTPRIKQQLPIVLLVPGNMAMTKHNNTSIGEFLASHPYMSLRISQNMHNTNATMPNNHLALNRQLQYNLFILNITLHCHYGRYGLQLIQNREDREIAGMDNQLHPCKMFPNGFGQLLKVR